jgi:hypothetical protein
MPVLGARVALLTGYQAYDLQPATLGALARPASVRYAAAGDEPGRPGAMEAGNLLRGYFDQTDPAGMTVLFYAPPLRLATGAPAMTLNFGDGTAPPAGSSMFTPPRPRARRFRGAAPRC